RWGNPMTYRRGTATDRKLYREHDVHWIEPGLPGEGNILLYNNGIGRPEGAYSSIEEIVTTVDSTGAYPDPPAGVPHGPAAAAWTFTSTPPESLYSSIISSAQRLPNGNTLICEGSPSGTFHEVTDQDSLVWLYVSPVGTNGPLIQESAPTNNRVFRAKRYAPDYAAFAGRDLTPQGPIELPVGTGAAVAGVEPGLRLRPVFPNPARSATLFAFSLDRRAAARLEVFDVRGRRVATLVDEVLGAGEHRREWRLAGVPSGVYFYALSAAGRTESLKLVVAR
ncbi:MAG TPA: T9SS type A sorting domain-containing protein, partial [bacterium]|nr:T9SS type A sorting domain-containing protein [bacterium]